MLKMKLRMEMVNVSKRQQPNQRAENSCEGHQSIFNTVRKSYTCGVHELAPKQKCIIVQ